MKNKNISLKDRDKKEPLQELIVQEISGLQKMQKQ